MAKSLLNKAVGDILLLFKGEVIHCLDKLEYFNGLCELWIHGSLKGGGTYGDAQTLKKPPVFLQETDKSTLKGKLT